MKRFRVSIISALLSLSTLIGFGTWAFRLLEDWTWAQSFYFTVATLTTVGYGDLHPTTDPSRIFAAVFILMGVGVVFAALTSIGSRYLATQEHQLSDNITRRIHHHEAEANQANKEHKKK